MADDSEKVIGVVREQGVDYDVNGEAIPWTEVYVKIKVAFRQKALKLLKGPRLSCFLCVALHVGDEGTAHPSIDTIMRETGYSRSVVCNALEELENLGFIEKQRRKHDSTLYHIRGYVWFGSESKPTLLGESQSSKSELLDSKSLEDKRLPNKRLPNEPKDDPPFKDKPITAKDNLSSGSKKPKADPLLFEKERATKAARAQSGGNYADPAQAGGADAAAEAVLVAMYGALGSEPPRRDSASWKSELGIISQALRDRDVRDVATARSAGWHFGLDNREAPQFANVHLSTFPSSFGVYVGKAKKQTQDAAGRRGRLDADNVEAQAAFEERRATEPPRVEGDPVWEQAKREIALQMTGATFDAWVRRTYGLGRGDGVYTVVAPDAPTRDWLDSRLKTTAERILVGFFGERVEVRFEVGG